MLTTIDFIVIFSLSLLGHLAAKMAMATYMASNLDKQLRDFDIAKKKIVLLHEQRMEESMRERRKFMNEYSEFYQRSLQTLRDDFEKSLKTMLDEWDKKKGAL
jgi:DNA anti-recombination protein RmuC